MKTTIPITDLQTQLRQDEVLIKDTARYWRELAVTQLICGDLSAAIFAHQQAKRNEGYLKEAK